MPHIYSGDTVAAQAMGKSKTSTKPPSGTRDFLPDDLLRRRTVIGVIQRIYESHGFVPVETPAIENLSTLLGKYGEEGDQLLYRLLHRRDALRRPLEQAQAEGRVAEESELADQGLRYDLTVPLARVVAQYGQLPRFFKRYQIQPVWRADRPGRGRFREFYQCDVDITGTTSLVAEAEVCAAVSKVLVELGFEDFAIKLNHRELLRAMIRAAGVDEADEGTALVAVDKLDKIGEQGVLEELGERGIAAEAGRSLLELVRRPELDAESADSAESTESTRADLNEATLEGLAARVDARGQAAIDGLRELLRLSAATPAGSHLEVDPALARGLGYYTGPIFEIAVADLAGSLGGGGRYDDLVGMFGKRQVPAVGFSLGLERILVVMEERGMFPSLSTGPDLMLCWMDVDQAEVMRVATTLRATGLKVEVYPEASKKLGKQLQYADAEGVQARFAAILGKDELITNAITLKHLASGRQQTLPLGEVSPIRLESV
ncbi:histidine--tRNA ligase [Pseudenhygromyxa sp. WMMC2535]|uniref:histidine--tRNA ligase n=1 Tax=Pseudenhygromyxa sp. WMMC2535 TaxID=2712867 RepID=UPI001551DCB6|nr:histidine--tRNA ligase [Pseudenhygromyxa sp. WMMC2535]NVB38165.1 histidine--tRNA ligase [Pseudenhygromyxa sp. WMMC2535]